MWFTRIVLLAAITLGGVGWTGYDSARMRKATTLSTTGALADSTSGSQFGKNRDPVIQQPITWGGLKNLFK